MRFLVIAEQKSSAMPASPEQMAGFLENVMKPSAQILDQWERDGKAKGGVFVGQRKGAFVVDVSSPEELDQMLTCLPFWPMMTFDVQPLITGSGDRVQRLMDQMQAAKGK